MRPGFIARRAAASEQSTSPASAEQNGGIPTNQTELTFADIGARLGEDNEKLRNLLIDTGHRIGAIGDAQKAFRELAEPIKTAIRDLEQERIENTRLRDALTELRTGYDTLHGRFSALEKQAAELERDRAGGHQQLAQVQRIARGLETDNAELTSEIAAARGRLGHVETSLATAQSEVAALSTARDEAEERHRSEVYSLNLRIEALRSRAATAEKLLSEVRQSLVLRTEELRLSERKATEANVVRAATENTIEGLTAARDSLEARVKKLEVGRTSLIERSDSLAEALKAREVSLAQAERKIKSLTDRVAEIEVDAGAYRAKAERRVEELTETLQRERVASRDALDGKIREIEQARTSLMERSNSLTETLKAREAELAQAERKIKSLTQQIAAIEAEARGYRENIERRIEELNQNLQRERAAARDALDVKIRELEQDRTSLIERSNILADALNAREAARVDAERKITSLTDRIAQIEAEAHANFERERGAERAALDDKIREFERERASFMEQSDAQAGILKAREAELAQAEQKVEALTGRIAKIEADGGAYRTETERRIEELNEALQRERDELAAARDVTAGKMREFEEEGASLIERSNGLAEILRRRELELSQAQQNIKSLTDRLGQIEAEAAAYRAKAESRIEGPPEGSGRERVDRDGRAALAIEAKEFERERASLVARSDELAETLRMREAALAHAEQHRKSLTGRMTDIQAAAQAYRREAERHIGALNENLERERVQRAADREMIRKPGGQIAVFVSGKERKILVHEGSVPLFTIPVVIEDPDRPLGTHVFTAVGSTQNGNGIGWKLVTGPTALSVSVDANAADRASKPAAQASSTATEALHRIQWPKDAADRLIEFLIPGASLVISDDGFGPVTRSWCARIKLTERRRT